MEEELKGIDLSTPEGAVKGAERLSPEHHLWLYAVIKDALSNK